MQMSDLLFLETRRRLDGGGGGGGAAGDRHGRQLLRNQKAKINKQIKK